MYYIKYKINHWNTMPKCWIAGKMLTIPHPGMPGIECWLYLRFWLKILERGNLVSQISLKQKKRNLNLNFKRKATAFVVGLWTDLNFHFQFRQNWFQGCSKLSVKNIGSKKLCVLMVYCVLRIMQFNYI